MSGGKRFNIWIAYSDLFSNLAIFLFISAFGMLAALGSSDETSKREGGSQTGAKTCDHSFDFDILLDATKDNAIGFHRISLNGAPLSSCVHAYGISNYKFRAGKADIASFGSFNKPGRWVRAPDDALVSGLCEPLWGTITRNDFEVQRGHITIIGTGSPDKAICDPDVNLPPDVQKRLKTVWIANPDLRNTLTNPRKHRQFMECASLAENAKFTSLQKTCGSFAKSYGKCFVSSDAHPGWRDSTEACNDVRKMYFGDVVANKNCSEETPTKRAQSLYEYCRGAILSNNMFQMESIPQNGIKPGLDGAIRDGRYTLLRSTWLDRMSYEGKSPEEPLDQDGITKDSIYLIVQFDLKPPGANEVASFV